MTNFNDFKTATAVKNEARRIMFEMLREFLEEKIGAENVSQIGANELAVCLGTKDLTDGTTAEVCVALKPVAKDYETRTNTKKPFPAFERIIEEEAWETACKDKEEKKAERQREKEKRIAEGKVTKSKTEKQKALEQRELELEEVKQRVKEKLDKKTAEIYEKAKTNENKEETDD